MSTLGAERRLVWHGIFLFFLALLTGLAIPQFTNPRMGLSSHMEGLLNGMFLILLGLIWSQIRLSERVAKALFWLILLGAYGNWGATFVAAIFGTSQLTPIAGAGYTAAQWQEAIVSLGLLCVCIAMLSACLLVLLGLRSRKSLPGSAS